MKRNIDLLHEPILPALTRLALPIMATSLVQMAYNLTDMAWIGLVGADAVAAVGSASMYTWFSQGVSNLAKMGGQVKVAHALGRKMNRKLPNMLRELSRLESCSQFYSESSPLPAGKGW